VHCFAADRNGYLWTREEIGNSSFRAVDDPLGLPFLMKDYLENPEVWWNPAGRPSLREYGNNYAWSRALNLTTRPVYTGTSQASKTILLWDNHTMTLPSVHAVAEPSTGGPRAAPAVFRRFPHRNGKALGWLYLDGHVEIR
jgi:prepilin-type processing-associated H-X9-DG protein